MTHPDPAVDSATRLIRLLTEEIGPRRPCSPAEREAAEGLRDELGRAGLEPRIEEFRAYATFAAFHGPVLGAAALAGLIGRRPLRYLVAALAAAAGAAESRFLPFPGERIGGGRSRNLIADIPARNEERRTLCLLCHLDSSRSGLIFHPGVTPRLPGLVAAAGAALAVQALDPLLDRLRAGRGVVRVARGLLAISTLFLLERELRGEDVPGANDNASGTAVASLLAMECAREPLAHTRVVLLATGAEEAGVLGARAFLAGHDTRDWLFLNFDGVGAAASLHFLEREGGALQSWPSDPGLRAVAEDLAVRRPDLGLTGTRRSSGLPYDSTPVLARGGRALTLSVQNGSIPDYHWPTDTADRIDRDVMGRALDAGREMVRAIDRGEADT